MNRKFKFFLILLLMLLFTPKSVFAAETYDVVLFFGQSNMTGFAGIRDGENSVDARLTSLGVDSFSQKSGINKDILNRYSKMSHVDVDVPNNSAYEYIYETNSLKPITSSTATLGENLAWDTSTNKFITVGRTSYYASQESYGTNIIPQFASTYYKLTGRKIVAVMVANGGEEIAHFLPHNQVNTYSKSTSEPLKNQYIYEAMETKYNAAITYLKAHPDQYNIGKKFYIVFQGEADADYVTSGLEDADFYTNVYGMVHDKLINTLKLEYGGIIETVKIPGRTDYNGVATIHTAQTSLINHYDDIFLASSYPYDNYVPDEAHYQGSDYATALANSKLATCIVGEDEGNSIHFTSAALSQIGHESAQNAVKYLTNNNNWLTSLSLSGVPVDISDDTTFEVDVEDGIDSVDIGATTLHTGVSFVDGYGPRTVTLEDDETTALLKVKYGNQEKSYSIVFNRLKPEPTEDDNQENTVEQIVTVGNTGLNKSKLLIAISIVLIIVGVVMCLSVDKFLVKKEK